MTTTKRFLLCTLLLLPLAAQVQTVTNVPLITARPIINGNFTYLNTNKAGNGSCPSNQFAIQTAVSGVVCLPVDWSMLANRPGTFAPTAHAASHGTAGGDPVSLDASQTATGTFNSSRIPDLSATYLLVANKTGTGPKIVTAATVPADGCSTFSSGQLLSTGSPCGVSGGEANTGANVGASGVGIYDSKTGVALNFRQLHAASNKVTFTINGQMVDVDVVPGNLGFSTVASTGAYTDLTGKPTLGTSASRDVGTIAGKVAAGDDARLSDARTPTAHASTHNIGGSDAITQVAVLTTGAGAPSASCTAPSSSNLALYFDTTLKDEWYCDATNHWRKLVSINVTDAFSETGTTQSQAAAIAQNGGSIPSGTVLCYFDSTSLTKICLDTSSNAFTMVKGIANPSDTQVVNYVGTDGVQHRIAQSGGLGDPAANGVVRRTALNTTAVTTIPSDATQFLNGAATPAYAAVKDSDLSTSNVTTNDVSTSKHGFAPLLPNDATKFLNGTGAYTVPSGGGSTVSPQIFYPLGKPGYNASGTWKLSTAAANGGNRIPFNITGSTNSTVFVYVNVPSGATDAGKFGSVAIYNSAGTSKLCEGTPFSVGTAGWKKVSWASTCSLAPAPYTFYTTSDSATAQLSIYYNGNSFEEDGTLALNYVSVISAGGCLSTGSGSGIAFISNASSCTWAQNTNGVIIFGMGN